MSNGLSTTITCKYCNQLVTPTFEHANLLVCDHCNNVNRVQDNYGFAFSDYNLTNKFRLQQVLKTLKLHIPNTSMDYTLDGIMEMEYNEGSIFFLFAQRPTPAIYIHFEYQWYEATFSKGSVHVMNPSAIKTGDASQIFDAISYVIQREKDNKISLAGNVFLPAVTDSRTLVEHVVNHQLFFSFWSGHVYMGSFELKETTCPVNQTDFLHYTIQHTCSLCNKQHAIEGFPSIRSFICTCGTTCSIHEFGEVRELKTNTLKEESFLPLQAEATFDTVRYKVIGHVKKEDQDDFQWDEFTLWHKEQGFLYLSVFNGHWLKLNQVKLKNYVATNRSLLANKVFEDGESFDLFNDYQSKIVLSEGQFAGNIYNDGMYKAVEYTAPPKVWTFEKPHNEGVAAFKGEHLSEEDLRAAFQVELNLPQAKGIGMAQPFSGGMPVKRMRITILLGFLLVLATQFLSSVFNHNKFIFEQSAAIQPDRTFPTIQTDPFNLTKSYNNLEVEVNSDVTNSWLEAQVEVTNLNDGKSYTSEIGVEFYSGYEGGEFWSEGKRKTSFVFSALPKGKYQVNVTPAFDTNFPPSTYTIAIYADVPMYKNFWLILLFIAIPTIIFALVNYNREYYRWSNSNYSPFLQE